MSGQAVLTLRPLCPVLPCPALPALLYLPCPALHPLVARRPGLYECSVQRLYFVHPQLGRLPRRQRGVQREPFVHRLRGGQVRRRRVQPHQLHQLSLGPAVCVCVRAQVCVRVNVSVAVCARVGTRARERWQRSNVPDLPHASKVPFLSVSMDFTTHFCSFALDSDAAPAPFSPSYAPRLTPDAYPRACSRSCSSSAAGLPLVCCSPCLASPGLAWALLRFLQGRYQFELGKSFCLDCVPGRYASNVSFPVCQLCPAGRFNAINGSSVCDGTCVCMRVHA